MNIMLYILFWILGYVYSDKCYNKSSFKESIIFDSNGETESWFCCNNHEDINGICTECAIGYVSKDGLRCMPCFYGRYGKKCGNICSCQHNERCDIVHGCTEGKTVIPECEIGYVSKDGFPCNPCLPGKWGKQCVDTCSCLHNERCDIVHGCVEHVEGTTTSGSVESDKCYKNASNKETRSWFCCNNHVEKNGICVECKTGYVSQDGLPCIPCVNGKWGRKCGFKCNCQDHQKCDLVHGCVDRKIITSESSEKTKPTEMTTPGSGPKGETKDGLLLIVYVFSTGSIAALVTLASCCFKYKRKLNQSYNARSQIKHDNKAASEWKDICRNNERAKDIFNGDIMIDNSMLICIAKNNEHVNKAGIRYSPTVDQDLIKSSSSSDEGVSTPANEGVTNVFQSIIEVDIHRTLPDDTTQNFKKISSGHSELITYTADPIYGNIQPYIQIMPNCDVNEYTC